MGNSLECKNAGAWGLVLMKSQAAFHCGDKGPFIFRMVKRG